MPPARPSRQPSRQPARLVSYPPHDRPFRVAVLTPMPTTRSYSRSLAALETWGCRWAPASATGPSTTASTTARTPFVGSYRGAAQIKRCATPQNPSPRHIDSPHPPLPESRPPSPSSPPHRRPAPVLHALAPFPPSFLRSATRPAPAPSPLTSPHSLSFAASPHQLTHHTP